LLVVVVVAVDVFVDVVVVRVKIKKNFHVAHFRRNVMEGMLRIYS